jgi:putative membrane protein
MTMVKIGLLSLAASVLLVGMTMAQNSTASTGSNAGKSGITPAERHFMDKAAQGGTAEVQLGQLAQQNAQSEAVKQFAKRMISDHSKANDELKQIAAQESVSLPTTVDAKDKATMARLEKLHGAAFDKAYMQDMVMDHKKDVADFKHESTAAKTPSLKNWVQQTTPTLESHLQEAEKVAPQVGANTTAGMSEHNNTRGTRMDTSAQAH